MRFQSHAKTSSGFSDHFRVVCAIRSLRNSKTATSSPIFGYVTQIRREFLPRFVEKKNVDSLRKQNGWYREEMRKARARPRPRPVCFFHHARVDFFSAFAVAGFCALGLSGVRITHLNTRWARSTVPSLVPVRFAVRPPRSPSRTRRSSPRVAPSSVSRYAESPLRFRALGSIPASPGPSPIATLTTPVLLRDRQQYNRRFVNVVVGLGKKRSPNSNAT